MFWKRERTCPCLGCCHLAPGRTWEVFSRNSGIRLRKKKRYAAEFMNLAAVSQLASLPLEIRFWQQDCGLQRLRPPRLPAPRLGLEQSPAELSRSFARTPRGVQHWPEHRCIFS